MKTTRPKIPSPPAVTPIITPRLLLRPITQADLQAMHIIRSNPEVMYYSTTGLIDEDLAATQKWLDRFLSPNDTKSPCFVICERLPTSSNSSVIEPANSSEGPIIGGIGLAGGEPPEVGYRVRRQDWQKGYATEALTAFLKYYWALDRREAEVEDDLSEIRTMLQADESKQLKERLTAMIEVGNIGSRRVLEKCGFKLVEGKEWKPEPDHRGPATLIWYYLEAP